MYPLPSGATFDGIDLGPVCVIESEGNPVARQINEYPGINGIEVLNMGTRGGSAEVTQGILWSLDLSELVSREDALRAHQLDGGAYMLVESVGRTWGLAILDRFRPIGRYVRSIDGGWARQYRASFIIL